MSVIISRLMAKVLEGFGDGEKWKKKKYFISTSDIFETKAFNFYLIP